MPSGPNGGATTPISISDTMQLSHATGGDRWGEVTGIDVVGRRRRNAARLVSRVVDAPIRNWRWTITAAAIVVIILGIGALRGGPPPAIVPFQTLETEALELEMPLSIDVGEPIPVRVSGIGDAETAHLVVDSGYGLRQFEADTEDGQAQFEIPAFDVPAVGVIALTAIAGTATARSEITLVAGPAVDPLESHVGPRTIETTTDSRTMVVVIPEDSIGNPVSDGTAVDVTITRPALNVEGFTIETDDLLAWRFIESQPVAGRSRVGISVDGASSKELDFLEVAGVPDPFILEVPEAIPRADGRSIVHVRTERLLDRFGNVVPDGTTVFADVTTDGSNRRIIAQTIGGEAEFAIEAPSEPSTLEVVVNALGRLSEPAEIVFAPMIATLDVDTEPHPDGVLVRVGPIVSVLDAYIPDGTPVFFEVDGELRDRPTFNGVADLVVPESADSITVTVLGVERTIQVE